MLDMTSALSSDYRRNGFENLAQSRITPMRLEQAYRIATLAALFCGGLVSLTGFNPAVQAEDVDQRALELQAKRIAVIEKIKPSVTAIFAPGGQGGGSGVVVTKDGYALTNYHVVAGSGPVMQCGLPDGFLYDAVLVGEDKVGDVALIKLLPKKEGQEFPAAPLGDSDKLKAGDWSLAMGNPFLLATDFTPTVTFGMISGVHRYQYPEGRGLLEYTDCIQVDTSINPGNSGGPLFNMTGELIGINGRISIEKRGRVNSGVGYAISINQIKNFMGHLRAGLDVDHATLGAFIENKSEPDGTLAGMIVTKILEDCDAHRRGLNLEDELVSFAGRPVTNRNNYQNILGIFPKGWRVPLVYRRDNTKHEILVRLMGVQRGEIADDGRPKPPQPPPTQPKPKAPDSPAAKLYQAKPGFANLYFNKLERERLWNAFRKHGDFSTVAGDWTIVTELEVNNQRNQAKVILRDEKDEGKNIKTTALLEVGEGAQPLQFRLEPLRAGQETEQLDIPRNSGGLLMALYHYRRLLTLGEKGFEQVFAHGGNEPFYPPPATGTPRSLSDLRVDTEVLNTEHGAIPAKWFFAQKDQALLGCEVTLAPDRDPCELYFSDYKKVEGRDLPHRIEVRYGNGRFGTFTVKSYQFAAAK
jgi:S1-C subfamily serine protease